MLYHLTPRIYTGCIVELIDLKIPEFGLELKGGVELAARKPYPNKWYKVGCSKRSRRAVSGLLIDMPEAIDEFTVTTRWAICAEIVTTHRVTYKILDRDFEAASDSMTLWQAHCRELGGWSDRSTESGKSKIPVHTEPLMVTEDGNLDDEVDPKTGVTVFRREVFEMPTIEPERIFMSSESDRLPTRHMAFKVNRGPSL